MVCRRISKRVVTPERKTAHRKTIHQIKAYFCYLHFGGKHMAELCILRQKQINKWFSDI